MDILESAESIVDYTSSYTYQEFLNDKKTIDAVIRNFEIIGEASNKLSQSIKNSLPNIEWEKIRGFRNKLVHEYFGIDYQIIWYTKNELLPSLIIAIKNILKTIE
ncbi:DUF86 domain-containing protein [uncultured Mucilaginibacter sp.]|uniref:HepT-like ribonuclease domain-containing protein n=1 Tax=uncultured Mucilaginibacter sp. TaxID=797541 RepID=UPI002604998D|nr:DUF86 domain-containing protein [uncultured Mucilaginibacter sp.]